MLINKLMKQLIISQYRQLGFNQRFYSTIIFVIWLQLSSEINLQTTNQVASIKYIFWGVEIIVFRRLSVVVVGKEAN